MATEHAPQNPHEEHEEPHHEEGEGNWLISYADMMTLLMAFFALMYALSPQQTSSATSSAVAAQNGGPTKQMDNGETKGQAAGQSQGQTLSQAQAANAEAKEKMEIVQESLAEAVGGKVNKPFKDLADKLEKMIKENHLENQVKVESFLSSLSLKFIGSTVFGDAQSELNPELVPVVDKMLALIATEAKENMVTLEGHTDDRPIVSERFPSNWELSAQRAGTLARMLEKDGLTRDKILVVGYADSKPVAPNRNEKGEPDPVAQAKNRRVVVQLLKK